VIQDEKTNETVKETDKVDDKVQTTSSNDISIQLTTPQKSSVTVTESNTDNKTKSILGADFKSLTPNRPTLKFDTYITPTSKSITQSNNTTTPSTQFKQRLFHDSLLKRKSYSANPTRIQKTINKSMKALNNKHRSLFNSPSRTKKSELVTNSPLKKRSTRTNVTNTFASSKKSNTNTFISYLSNETPTPTPTNNSQNKGKSVVESSSTKSQNTKSKLNTTTTINNDNTNKIKSVDLTFTDDQPEITSDKLNRTPSLSLRDIDSKYEYMNDKVTPIKQKLSDISSSSPIVTTTTVTKKLGNITKIGVPAKDINQNNNEGSTSHSRRHSRHHSRRSSFQNLRSHKRKGVLVELKRKIDPLTGIISKLSVVEDPETGETTRIITSYDPETGNKTETKTITTTTTTMTTTTQSTTTRKTTTIDRGEEDEEDEEEETDYDFDNASENENNMTGFIEYSSSLNNSDEEGDNIFTKLNDTHSDEEFDQHSLVSNDLDAPPSINLEKTPHTNSKNQTMEHTPQNKYSVKDNNRKIGTYSVPSLHSKKFRLDESLTLDHPPYTTYSKGLNDQDRQSFNNVPMVGRLSLSNVDLNSPKYNGNDRLSNYWVTKNKLDLSALKKQYKLEKEINDNILNNAKPKSKIAECEEAIGNLLSKWTKEEEEKKEAEAQEESEGESLTFTTNIKEIQEEIQRRIEKNKKLNEEINHQSLQLSLTQQKETGK
ncbi:hypothetical protein PIROE2DRAFT_65603, partial [Piromyces sp. E2]